MPSDATLALPSLTPDNESSAGAVKLISVTRLYALVVVIAIRVAVLLRLTNATRSFPSLPATAYASTPVIFAVRVGT